MNDDKKYEKIGRLICTLAYWRYVIKYTFFFSIIAVIPLYLLQYPLWLAPIIGFGVFAIYRGIRRTIFRILYKLSRM